MTALLGPALALLSAALWGGADFGGGLLSRRRPAVAVVAWSQLCGFAALLAMVLATGTGPGDWRWLPWAVLAGVLGSAALVCFYVALSIGTMGVVSPIAALGAVVPVVLGVLAGERPTTLQVVGIVAALAGAAAASGPELSGAGGRDGARAVVLAALAGIGFGLALFAIARGAEHSTLLTLTGMRATSVAGFAVAAVALRSTGGVRPGDLPALAGIGLADAGANFLFGLASTMGLLSVTAVLGSLYPVVTVLAARLLLAERLRPVQQAGVAAALCGVVLLSAG